ncbi:MAG TPA: aminotransferase class I/II-fold pyridoxal phosphate-dependent enzyme, partial [Bacillota bacterium]
MSTPSELSGAPTVAVHEPGAGSSWRIPLCVPHIGGNAWAYVKECLDTGWVAGGSFIERFERAVAREVGVPHAVACSSGTAALHVALRVAGVEPDDEVFVPALTFIAPANAVRYLGARPVFVDADPEYWQMDPGHLERIIATRYRSRGGELRNRSTGRRARAILPVHILGHPVDMDPVLDIARRHGLTVVEDATESLGARYRGKAAGALGDIACFSFNGNKLITTGGGGMIVTANASWADHARYLIT